ncbi:MAG: hypothetical protein NT116_01925, partial [Candidatus Parcubacteria bacterium]|nr:hypothetical protein [Candidatus Parcubacteria bacterium]
MIKVKNKIIISVKIIIFSVILTIGHQGWAALDSGNYKIWLDNLGAYGGKTDSTNYSIDSNFTDQAGANAQSANFKERPNFSGIGSEPTIGFSVQVATLNFGELSPLSTAYTSHTFSAYSNSKAGYTIKVNGGPLHNSEHTFTQIGSTAQDSVVSSEQFGINLVS